MAVRWTTSTRKVAAGRGNPDMAGVSESGVNEVQGPEQGLQVLARMIARAYARDNQLARGAEPEHSIPCYSRMELGHSQMGKAQVRRDR